MVAIVVELDVAQLQRQIAQVDASLQDLGKDTGLDELDDGFRRSGDSAQRTGTIIGGVKGIIATVVTTAVVRQILDFAQSWEAVERAVATVIPNTAEASAAIDQLAEIANRTGLSVVSIAESFKQYDVATNNLNLSTEETIELVGAIAQALSVYANSTGEAEAATTQLAQAFAKGKLDGDELKTVLEVFPALSQALADELGAPVESLRELGEEGKITGEVLRAALLAVQEDVQETADRIGLSLPQAFENVTNNTTRLVGALFEVTGASEFLRDSFLVVADAIDLFRVNVEESEGVIGAFFTTLGDLAVQALTALSDGLLDANSSIEEIAAVGLVGLIGFFEEATTQALGFGDRLLELSGISGTVTGAFETVVDVFGDVLDAIAELDAIQQLQATFEGFAETAGDAFGEMADVIQDAFDAAIDKIRELLDFLPESVQEFLGLSDAAEQASDDLADFGESAEDAAEGLETLNEQGGDAVDVLDDSAAGADDTAASFFALGDAASFAGTQVQAFAATANDAFEELPDTIQDVADEIEVVFGEEAAGTIEDFSVESGEKIGTFVDDVIEVLDGVGISLQDIFGEKAGTVIEDFRRFFSRNFDEIERIAGAVFDFFGFEFADVFGGTGIDSITTFAQTAIGAFSGGGGFGGGILGSIGSVVSSISGGGGLLSSLGSITSFIPGLSSAFSSFGGIASGSLGGIISSITGGGGLLSSLGSIGSFLPGLGGAFASLGGLASGALGGIGTAATGLIAALGPIGLVIGGIIAVFGLLELAGVDVFGAIADAAQFAFDLIRQQIELFIEIHRIAFETALSIVQTVFEAITSVVTTAFDLITEALGFVVEIFQAQLDLLIELHTAAFDAILSVVTAVFDAITSALSTLLGFFQGVLSTLLDTFTSTFGAILSTVTSVFTSIVSAAGAMLSSLLGVLSSLASAAASTFSSILSAATSAFSSVISAASSMASAVGSALSSIASAAASVFSSVASAAASAFSAVASAAASAASSAISSLGRIAGAVGSAVSSISSGISGAIGSVGSSLGIGRSGTFASRIAARTRAAEEEYDRLVAAGRRPSISRSAFIRSRLATGGIITGPVQLSSDQSFGQSSFGDGGLLPGLTGIASSGNIVGPFNAVAGEAGPEAILPLTQTSQGLGVSATGLTGTDVRIFIIEGVDRDTTDRLEREILELDASIEFRAGVQAESLLLGGL